MAGMPIRRQRRLAKMRADAEERERLGIQTQPQQQPFDGVFRPALRGSYQGDFPDRPEPKSDDVLALAPPEKLAELVTLALARAHDILKIKLDPLHQDFIKLVSLQQSTLASVLATQARTDPGRLRGQQGDKIGELLDRIRAGAATLA